MLVVFLCVRGLSCCFGSLKTMCCNKLQPPASSLLLVRFRAVGHGGFSVGVGVGGFSVQLSFSLRSFLSGSFEEDESVGTERDVRCSVSGRDVFTV